MNERTLFDILTLVKDGGRPTYDELLYALMAVDALAHFDRDFIMSLPEKPNRQKHLAFWAEETFQRYKRALDQPPREWLGPNYDPANPSCQWARKTAMAILEKESAGKLAARSRRESRRWVR